MKPVSRAAHASAIAAVWIAMLVAAVGQAPQPPPSQPSRTSDGQPSLEGFWNSQSASLSSLEEGLNEHDRRLLGGDRSGYGYREARTRPQGSYTSPIVDPPDGKIPYQAWALKK